MSLRAIVRPALFAVMTLILAPPLALASESSSDAAREAVHLDHERLDAIRPALEAEVAHGVRAGFVAGVASRSGETFVTVAGLADRKDAVPMAPNTRFRIASMTKPIITAAIMQLVDRGVIALSDPVSRYVPAYADARVATAEEPDGSGVIPTRAPARPITIHDLLTHTAGIGYVFDNQSTLDRLYVQANLFGAKGTLAERIERIAKLPLYNDPGEEWRYSYSIDVAALLIEVATGEPLEAYLKRNLFEPLKMSDTEFFLDKTDFERLATVYRFAAGGHIKRAKDDGVSGDLNKDGFGVISGGAGLVSSAPDYLRFCLMMLREGELDGVRVLSPASARMMMSDQLRPGANGRLWERASSTFGFGGTVVVEPSRATDVAVAGEWGWSGHWDTWFIVNPADGVAAVLLAQTQPTPYMPPSKARETVKAIAYGAAKN